ncbi:hypothetical protein G9A89_010196 [Geosiphon pyriformis]|nr:hypothetical protein G9A89_010196 [Geosiphon pyriformis]
MLNEIDSDIHEIINAAHLAKMSRRDVTPEQSAPFIVKYKNVKIYYVLVLKKHEKDFLICKANAVMDWD